MRVIAGISGGIRIKVPRETTRPTTDRVREAVFSSLGDTVVEAAVLDLYAGSGSLGIESLSRGALSAVFVDQSKKACQTILANLEKTSLNEKGSVRASSVERFLDGLASTARFDLVFADPPYVRDGQSADLLERFLRHETLPAILNDGGVLVLESSAQSDLPEAEAWSVLKDKTYGETRVTFFCPNHS